MSGHSIDHNLNFSQIKAVEFSKTTGLCLFDLSSTRNPQRGRFRFELCRRNPPFIGYPLQCQRYYNILYFFIHPQSNRMCVELIIVFFVNIFQCR